MNAASPTHYYSSGCRVPHRGLGVRMGKEKKRGSSGGKDKAGKKAKKRKLMKRCTSPSHFLVDPEEEVRYGPDYSLELPGRGRIDDLLRANATMYYRPKELHTSGTSVWVNGEYDSLEYPTIDLLLSPLRKTLALDNWSPKEIALFEAGMCRLGKNFHQIQKLIKTKDTQEIVEFYYTCWKQSQHYQIWKQSSSGKFKAASATKFLRRRDEAASTAVSPK